jgi:hypothetical protein
MIDFYLSVALLPTQLPIIWFLILVRFHHERERSFSAQQRSTFPYKKPPEGGKRIYSLISSASWMASASAATSWETLRRSIWERIPEFAVDAETDALEISKTACTA